jgi:hypothetical protein
VARKGKRVLSMEKGNAVGAKDIIQRELSKEFSLSKVRS